MYIAHYFNPIRLEDLNFQYHEAEKQRRVLQNKKFSTLSKCFRSCHFRCHKKAERASLKQRLFVSPSIFGATTKGEKPTKIVVKRVINNSHKGVNFDGAKRLKTFISFE